MLAAHLPYQRHPGAKLLAADGEGVLRHMARERFADLLRPGDLVVANDAATMPASLAGQHVAAGVPIEVRLAARGRLAADEVRQFSAVVFGAGDFHQRTEDRPLPPALGAGDRLVLGPLTAVVERVLEHPRLIALRFEGLPDEIWAGIARYGRPIQYAHVAAPLALWDVWTPIAGPPVAFEPPSAGFAIDWRMLASLAARGAGFATITHAAGISSTGDAELDRLLPLDEPYRIPGATVEAIRGARKGGGRVIAIGTTVVRALEHRAAGDGCVRAGEGMATQRIGAGSRLRVVDAILSGTHEPGTSHYELLRAFADDATLRRMEGELEARGYRTHEFGDSVFVEGRGDTSASGGKTSPVFRDACRASASGCSS
ncbi:MAG TPA: S-adenosylmethionine:tRNA ribosyltransferase-isomerase [Candidatus Acidoferrales bacterium]|jgi:S-adenosylmethionine:tRNA ribosyltransferase-isomerase|nr:S-adenosylmethionine:tRNA ribosyltransferase-isomerase [Candidatus Acidoferrales bacterium]